MQEWWPQLTSDNPLKPTTQNDLTLKKQIYFQVFYRDLASFTFKQLFSAK